MVQVASITISAKDSQSPCDKFPSLGLIYKLFSHLGSFQSFSRGDCFLRILHEISMQNTSMIDASFIAATRGSGATATGDTGGIATYSGALAMHGKHWSKLRFEGIKLGLTALQVFK